jgi:FkbM family methyltransferase
MYSGASRMLKIDKGAFKLRFHNSNLAAQLWLDPDHRRDDWHGRDEEMFMRRHVRAGDVVVDIGANIGFTALLAWSLVGKSGAVYAFEPHPRTFRFLTENIRLNRAHNITAFHLALGDTAGTTGLSNEKSDDQNAVDAQAPLRVEVARLDDISELREQRVRLLKIDVEGYERFVLAGATDVLSRTEIVFCEHLEALFNQYGYTGQEVRHLLQSAGFSVHGVLPDGRLTEPWTPSSSSRNIVAVREPL